jgi:hypothetical protein
MKSSSSKLYVSVSYQDRAVKIGKQEQYWRIKAPPAAGAPYDRLSDLLHTKVRESVYPPMLLMSAVNLLNRIVSHILPI